MSNIKEWITKHKKEIAVGTAIIFAYKLGFKHGCIASNMAVSNVFNEASKVLEVTRF